MIFKLYFDKLIKKLVSKYRLNLDLLISFAYTLLINNILHLSMSVLLGKYKTKKKLGKGAYGDVMLVEDPAGN